MASHLMYPNEFANTAGQVTVPSTPRVLSQIQAGGSVWNQLTTQLCSESEAPSNTAGPKQANVNNDHFWIRPFKIFKVQEAIFGAASSLLKQITFRYFPKWENKLKTRISKRKPRSVWTSFTDFCCSANKNTYMNKTPFCPRLGVLTVLPH